MPRVTVGYLDNCMHPLWLTRVGLRAARFFGAQSLWFPDHFASFVPAIVWKPELTPAAKIIHSPDAFLDPLQMLAVAAVRFRGVDLGTAVTEAYRRHPMSLAQSFVTLDHLSKGHAILGIGNGERVNVEPYGLPWGKRVSRLEEALTIIRLLWESRGEPVSYAGKYWELKDAIFNLPLYKDRPPRIWVASHAPRMLSLTGRFADGWLPVEKATPEEYAHRLGLITDAALAAGRSMESFVPGLLLFPTVLGASRDQVLELVMGSGLRGALALGIPGRLWEEHGLEHPLGNEHGGNYEILPTQVTEEHVEQANARVTPELVLSVMYMGSPAEVFEEVAPLVDVGVRHFVVTNAAGFFSGGGIADMWRIGSLIRKLRRLSFPK